MGSVYSGSYMGFPAPPRLKPWRVNRWQRRAAILRAAGITGEWQLIGDTWWVITGQAWATQSVGDHQFTSTRAFRHWLQGQP